MQYNLLTSSICWATLSGGRSFIYDDLYNMSNHDDLQVCTLSGSDILVAEFDLGRRVHIDRFEYKYIDYTSTPENVASGIEFYCRNELFEEYMLLQTLYSPEWLFYTTATEGGILAPRYLKCRHVLSETLGVTTTSGSMYGFKAFNNDSIVNFGEGGDKEQESIEVARGAAADIRGIPIYNNGNNIANALINIEPSFSSVDDVLSISNSINGPWTKALDANDVRVHSYNVGNGTNIDTTIRDNLIVIDGAIVNGGKCITKSNYGSYISPIIKKTDISSSCRLLIEKDVNSPGRIVVDTTDTTETIEFRSSNVTPKTYAAIRTLTGQYDGSYSRLSYRDYTLLTQEYIPSSTSLLFGAAYGVGTVWQDYGIVNDKITDRNVCWAVSKCADYRYRSELYLFNNFGSSSISKQLSRQTDAYSIVNFNFRQLKLDYSGGFWAYFFCQSYASSDFVDASGYYLVYFDVSMNNTFKWFLSTDEIGTIDVNYNTRELWYTRPSSSAIYKIGIDGTVTAEFSATEYTNALGGMAVLPSGNLLYSNGKYIHYLKYNGAYIDGASILSASENSIDYISLDGDGSEAIWVIDGLYVGRLFVAGPYKGMYDFRVGDIGFPVSIESVSGGVWVKCAEAEVTSVIVMKFISKENRRVDSTYVPAYSSSPAIIYNDYNDINYNKRMPVQSDTVWKNLPWTKIATGSYLLPEDDYYQLRITLHRQTPFEAWPGVTSNMDQPPISEDYFEQVSTTPNQLMWGDWSDKPSTSRVYALTTSGTLFMASGYTTDSFIDTIDRVAYGTNTNGILEMIVGYRIGNGNGILSGKEESVIVTLYSVDPSFSGMSISAKIVIPVTPLSNNTNVFISRNTYTTGASVGVSANYYEGEIRIYIDFRAGTVISGWRAANNVSWINSSTLNNTVSQTGAYFRLNISGSKSGSSIQIKHVYMKSGQAYHYLDTPMISSIYEQKLIEVNGIYPKNSKDMYIKTFVPKDLSVTSGNDVNVKVMWRVVSY